MNEFKIISNNRKNIFDSFVGSDIKEQDVLIKAHIKQHQRKTKSGKIVQVREHEDSRIKKQQSEKQKENNEITKEEIKKFGEDAENIIYSIIDYQLRQHNEKGVFPNLQSEIDFLKRNKKVITDINKLKKNKKYLIMNDGYFELYKNGVVYASQDDGNSGLEIYEKPKKYNDKFFNYAIEY